MLAVSCVHKFGSIRLRGGVVSRSHSSLSKRTDTSISLHPRARVAIYGRSRPLRTLHFYLQVPLRSLWWARARAWVLTRVPRRSASLTFVGLRRWKASMRTSARSAWKERDARDARPTSLQADQVRRRLRSAVEQLKQQVRIKDGERQRAKLTKTELEGLPDDVTLYRALGRSFVMAPKPVLMQEIDEAQAGCQEDVDTLKKNIHYCEKKAGELDQQLRELLTHTPALAAALAGASS
eukprot:scaffold350_cov333-Pavlova_lutheri.AAC.48